MATGTATRESTTMDQQRIGYGRTIRDLELLLEKTLAQQAAAPTGGRAAVLEDKIGTIAVAIEIWKEAAELDLGGKAVQFGARNARNLKQKVPPYLDEYSARHRPMVFENHIFVTDKPIEVVTLRRVALENPGLGIEEMDVGMRACVAKEGDFIGFMPTAYYLQLAHAGALKF